MGNFTKGYGSYIVESRNVLSNDLNVRLKGYLDDDSFRTLVTDIVNAVGPDEKGHKLLSSTDSDVISKGDTVRINTKKKDGIITVICKVINKELAMESVDFDIAAYNINRAVDGIGTDEDTIGEVGAALSSIAIDAGLDASTFFNELDARMQKKYGESLKEIIDGDFDGDAEVIAMNIYKRPIEKSVIRGLNFATILFDLGLTVATLGSGTAAMAAVKTGAVATRVAAKVKPAIKLISRFPGLSKISKAKKAEILGKNIKKGYTIIYKTQTAGKTFGNPNKYKILNISKEGKVHMQMVNGSKVKFWKNADEVIKGIDPKTSGKIMDGLKIKVDPALAGALTLAAKKGGDAISRTQSGGESQVDAMSGAGFAEIMGYYDSLAADPAAYAASIESYTANELAEKLYTMSQGGTFGFTSDQEELGMALIITSLTREVAQQLDKDFSKYAEDGETVVSILKHELDGDIAALVIPYWVSLLGSSANGGAEELNAVNSMIGKIKKS
jgi:hypothetical protein